MRKLGYKSLAFVVFFAFAVSGCKSPWADMAKNYKGVTYEIKPNPLELTLNSKQEQKVPVTISGTFPAKYFDKNAIVAITPVIKTSTGQEIALKSVTVQGEKVRDNNEVIVFEKGGNFRYTDVVNYSSDMRLSELVLKGKATHAKKSTKIDFEPRKLADGIVTTCLLAAQGIEVDNAGSEFASLANAGRLSQAPANKLPETSTTTYNASIQYEMQRAEIRKTEISKPELAKLFADYQKAKANSLNYKGIVVSSYASPDGSTSLNEKLSKDRANAANKYLQSEFDKIANPAGTKKGKKVKTEIPNLESKTTAEDWDGFEKAMNDPNNKIKDRDAILRVLKMYSDPDQREREIKNLAAAFEDLKTQILPSLRRSKIDINFETAKKSDSELTTLAATNPDKLTQDEFFNVAVNEKDLAKKAALYQKYTQKYPNDWKGFNNLGVVYAYQNKPSDASAQFEKANSIQKNQMSTANIGALAMANKDYKKAEDSFNEALSLPATDATANANYNLGHICMLKGDYQNALKYYGSQKCYNVALAQLMLGSADKSLGTLNAMGEKDNANYFYLKAILGARTNNESLLFTNLEKAVKKDASFKEYAKKDVEFIKFFSKDKFKSITQ